MELEIKYVYDLGEKLILQMKEFNLFLKRKISEKQNEKQRKAILSNKQ